MHLVDNVLDESDGDFSAGDYSLREAIEQANLSPGAESIWFSPALIGSTIVLQHSQLTITDHLTLSGLGPDALSLSGDNSTRVLSIAAGVEATITDVAIENGKGVEGGGIGNAGTLVIENVVLRGHEGVEGGAVYNSGSLGIFGTTITNNSAEYGGGIENYGTVGVTDTAFTHNFAYEGGAIDNYEGSLSIDSTTLSHNHAEYGGAISNYVPLSIKDSTIANNHATESGGAIYNDSSVAVLQHVIVEDNVAGGYGGGVFNERGTLTVTESTFQGNRADSGGGIRNRNGATTIQASTFAGNSTRLDGGAIETISVGSSTSLTIDSSTFASNSANRGGAIESIFSDTKITNSTVSGNTAKRDGGGIWNFGPLQIDHSTITGNVADVDGNDTIPEGGGLFSGVGYQPRAMVSNTIVAGNLHGTSAVPDDIGGLVNTASSFNLVGDAATSGSLVNEVNGNIVGNAGSGTIDIGVVLDPELTDNGGPTETHALVAGSPAIDAGNSLLPYDQRGSARTLDGDDSGTAASDIGAYERVTLGSLITPLEEQVRMLGANGVISHGEETRLLNFLELTRRNVDHGKLGKSAHFLGLFIGHVNRLAGSGTVPAPTAVQLTDATRPILEHLQAVDDEHRALDQLFDDFVFDWD